MPLLLALLFACGGDAPEVTGTGEPTHLTHSGGMSSGRIDREVVSCADEADLHAAGEFSHDVCELVKTCEACEQDCPSACNYVKGSGDTGIGRYTCGTDDYRPGAYRAECQDSGNP